MAVLLTSQLGGVSAQEQIPSPGKSVDGSSPEILTRGPVHEAFAEPVNPNPQVSEAVPKEPPPLIQEVPPQYKPEGANATWIPGYWAWDEDQGEFIWVSGVWRVVPPGRHWVPGYWHRDGEGVRWVAGYWNGADSGETASQYLVSPPESLEVGPSVAAPNAQHFWVPGCWLYGSSEYRWRPGFWYPLEENWIWVPAQYLWTPGGCVFVAGYWDYRLPYRGQLFAPVCFRGYSGNYVGLSYSPSCLIDVSGLMLHLFVRPSFCHYYFGDYYDPIYAGRRILPCYRWHSSLYGYDPLISFYDCYFRHRGIDYVDRLHGWNRYFTEHREQRPSRVFREEFEHDRHRDFRGGDSHVVLGRSLSEAIRDQGPERKFVRMGSEQAEQLRQGLDHWSELAERRQRVETAGSRQSSWAERAAQSRSTSHRERESTSRGLLETRSQWRPDEGSVSLPRSLENVRQSTGSSLPRSLEKVTPRSGSASTSRSYEPRSRESGQHSQPREIQIGQRQAAPDSSSQPVIVPRSLAPDLQLESRGRGERGRESPRGLPATVTERVERGSGIPDRAVQLPDTSRVLRAQEPPRGWPARRDSSMMPRSGAPTSRDLPARTLESPSRGSSSRQLELRGFSDSSRAMPRMESRSRSSGSERGGSRSESGGRRD